MADRDSLTTPESAAGSPTHLRVDRSGRLLLPAPLRAAMGLRGEGKLVATPQPDGSLRLEPLSAIVERLQAKYRAMPPREDGMLWSDSLIADRHAEAERE
jgi:bifunctional DNA-binding transcriptional regulator/antitoxin component of YhaV-PrlF toxin-antitoxin module